MDSQNTPVIPPSKEDSLEKIVARVDFYESSVEQLKKDVPKYFAALSTNDKHHSSLSKVLRTVASNEPHSLLQYVLFAYAQREEDLAAELAHMKDFSEESKAILDDWNKKLITPMRMLIQDHNSTAAQQTKPKVDVDGKQNGSSSPLTPRPTTIDVNEFLRSPVLLHAKLFEKHRISELTVFLQKMLTSQIAVYTKAIESYSQLLECLAEIQEIDTGANPLNQHSKQ